jgi:hypothetical protein
LIAAEFFVGSSPDGVAAFQAGLCFNCFHMFIIKSEFPYSIKRF